MPVKVQLDPGNVPRKLLGIGKRSGSIVAQELNRQNRTFRGGTGAGRAGTALSRVTGFPRRMVRATGIVGTKGSSALKRIRKRTVIPRAGWANPKKLFAGGLTLFETLPARYWQGRAPTGKVIPVQKDGSGRTLVGGAFDVQLKSGATGKMKRLEPQTWYGPKNPGPNTNYLPINWAYTVDVTDIAYRERFAVLTDLARAFPSQMAARWNREFKRALGA